MMNSVMFITCQPKLRMRRAISFMNGEKEVANGVGMMKARHLAAAAQASVHRKEEGGSQSNVDVLLMIEALALCRRSKPL